MLRALASREWRRREMWFGAHCVEGRSGAIRSSIFTSVLQTQPRKPGIERRAASREPLGGAKRSTSRLNSRGGARSVVRRRGIREEIIGRSAALLRVQSVVAITRRGDFAFAVLHDPSREHRGGNFFHPLIEHRGHLLAQIGGVTQAGKLIALQTVSRRGQQKFPRGGGHYGLAWFYSQVKMNA